MIRTFIVWLLLCTAAHAQLGPIGGGAPGSSGQYTYNSGGSPAGSGNLSISGTTDTEGGTLNVTGASSALKLNSNFFVPTPGGRLTLTSTTPVMQADVALASGTSVYYEPYSNALAPNYNGTVWTELSTVGGLTLTLNTTDMPTTNMFDVYLLNVSGTPTLCSMYWGGNTSRSTTAGGKAGTANASITLLNGIWVNNAAIATANCYNNTTSYAISQNQGTLLGSFYTGGAGETAFVCKPTGASGGAPVLIYISNAYNQVPASCSNRDTATAITSASSSWALLGASDSLAWVDSLQQNPAKFDGFIVAGNGSAAGDCGQFGIAVGGTGTSTPTVHSQTCAPTATLADNYQTLATSEGFYPVLGLQTAYAEKQSATGTTTYMPVTGNENATITVAY